MDGRVRYGPATASRVCPRRWKSSARLDGDHALVLEPRGECAAVPSAAHGDRIEAGPARRRQPQVHERAVASTICAAVPSAKARSTASLRRPRASRRPAGSPGARRAASARAAAPPTSDRCGHAGQVVRRIAGERAVVEESFDRRMSPARPRLSSARRRRRSSPHRSQLLHRRIDRKSMADELQEVAVGRDDARGAPSTACIKPATRSSASVSGCSAARRAAWRPPPRELRDRVLDERRWT